VRLSCICRHVSIGKEERYCFGVSMGPNGGGIAKLLKEIDASYLVGPHTGGLESMPKEEALARIQETEGEGNCHTIWTFVTPFLAGICNCSLPGCYALKTTITHKSPVFFRGEYVAKVAPDKCSGCGQCVKICSFKAFKPRKKKDKAEVDALRCYGCGICRSVCVKAAITLADRAAVPAAASLWL
jgi:Pyruvate/2-oxoacid:ferredoxin oxidoreductase delta subunit